MSQYCAFVAKMTTEKLCQQVKGGHPSPLLSPSETCLQYWVQVQAPWDKGDSNTPKQSQSQATKVIKGLEYLSYEKMLRELGLEKRTLRGISPVYINT